ncbi:MAG: indolepyruvate oxidoreductase subunit beta [Desulfovibrionales bacterium]
MKKRIFLVGVGGQGTLTATNLLGRVALESGIPVVAGEIHGMAQRGGVVESTILLGGYQSPRISRGQADILVGFEPLETLRALRYLKPGGLVVSNSEQLPPPSVARGMAPYPEEQLIRSEVLDRASRSAFIPCMTLGTRAGAVQSGNMVLLAALCASEELPFGLDALRDGVRKFLKPKLVDMNLRAIELGAEAFAAQTSGEL